MDGHWTDILIGRAHYIVRTWLWAKCTRANGAVIRTRSRALVYLSQVRIYLFTFRTRLGIGTEAVVTCVVGSPP